MKHHCFLFWLLLDSCSNETTIRTKIATRIDKIEQKLMSIIETPLAINDTLKGQSLYQSILRDYITQFIIIVLSNYTHK